MLTFLAEWNKTCSSVETVSLLRSVAAVSRWARVAPYFTQRPSAAHDRCRFHVQWIFLICARDKPRRASGDRQPVSMGLLSANSSLSPTITRCKGGEKQKWEAAMTMKNFSEFFQKSFFILWLKWVIYSLWNWSMGEGSDNLLHFLFWDNIILFRWECGNRSVGMGAWGQECGDGSNFFGWSIFKTCFLCYDSKTLIFSHWHGSVGPGEWLFVLESVFRLHLFDGAGGCQWEFRGKSV